MKEDIETVQRSVLLKFIDGGTVPDVPKGQNGMFIVVTENEGRNACFPGYYLNAMPLDYPDECICETDKGHEDGCPTTGWFYDESNFEYDHCYYQISGKVLFYAPLPKASDLLPSPESPAPIPPVEER